MTMHNREHIQWMFAALQPPTFWAQLERYHKFSHAPRAIKMLKWNERAIVRTCAASTQAGKRCQRSPIIAADYCGIHVARAHSIACKW